MKRSGPGHRRAAHRSAARRSHAHGRRRPAEPGVAAPSPPESPRTRSPHARMPAAAAALPAPPSARARASRKSRTAPWRSVRPAPHLLRRLASRSADTPLLWPLGVHVPACEKSACQAHTTWESVTCSGRGQEPTPTRWLRPGPGPPGLRPLPSADPAAWQTRLRPSLTWSVCYVHHGRHRRRLRGPSVSWDGTGSQPDPRLLRKPAAHFRHSFRTWKPRGKSHRRGATPPSPVLRKFACDDACLAVRLKAKVAATRRPVLAWPGLSRSP